jgi:E3 ubiquitin-protein ligase FANCL
VTSRSFHLFIYFLWAFRLQIEEIGWERVVSAAGDDGVSCLTFRVV